MKRATIPASQKRLVLLFVLAVATASALVVSQAVAWVGVRRAAKTLQRGEAQRALAVAQQRIQARGRRPTQGEMDALLRELAEDDVRWVAVIDPSGVVESGAPLVGVSALPPRPGALEDVGPRVRGATAIPPPLEALQGAAPPVSVGGPLAPAHFLEGPLARALPLGPRGERSPLIVVEVEPRTSRALENQAAWTLVVGIVAALLVVVTAISMRRAVLARELTLIRAERSRHLASLGEMSAVLAHEIRNPLASLKGNAQLLEEALAEGSRERRKAGVVVREAVRIEALVTDLLDFVRKGRMQLREVDPREVVRAAVEAVDAKRLALDDARAPDRVAIDPERLRQALENVMRNALQASPEGAEVRVEGDDVRWRVTVRDRGPGIAPEIAQKLFEPFQTTKTKGTGLGLAITRRIVEGHGGSIRASNHPEGGAVFVMEVPLDGR